MGMWGLGGIARLHFLADRADRRISGNQRASTMPEDSFALSMIAPAAAEQDDYDAICDGIMESARGRWFLAEYARRNRNTDTNRVLAAIERIENLFRSEPNRQTQDGIRADTQGEGIERDAKRLPACPEILAIAERLRETGRTMRERGLDGATCEEIESLASAVAAAPSLQDASDHRAQELKQALQYLEQRVCATPPSTRMPRAAAGDPLAALKAMTDEERIALFT